MVVHTKNPGAGETGRSSGFMASEPTLRGELQARKRLPQKEGRTSEDILWPLHKHTHMHIHTNPIPKPRKKY